MNDFTHATGRAATDDRRRDFLRLAGRWGFGLIGTAMLSGCGGGSDDAPAPVTIVPGGGAAVDPPPVAATDPLNLALNLAYVGAQFHTLGATGAAVASSLTTGTGRPGAVVGGRRAAFADPMLARYAAELSAHKTGHLVALRAALGPTAAAQPGIDLSAGATSAFSVAAQGAGLVSAGSGFDAFANDANYLLGAFMIENVVAAAYRGLLDLVADPAAALVADQLGDAIYHGGLIRSMLDAKATEMPSLDASVRDLSALMASLDGTGAGDHSFAAAGGAGANADVVDADGRAIPFTRDAGRVLRVMSLSTGGAGGFLPAGANGVLA